MRGGGGGGERQADRQTNLKYSAVHWMSTSNLSTQRSGNSVEEETKECKTKRDRRHKKAMFSKST